MSHVSTIDIDVTDLGCLAEACNAAGLELMIDQKKFHWYGRHVGDYPVPDGFAVEDMGKCEHMIRVKPHAGLTSKPYEIGVVKRRDGRPGYTLLYDFYHGGYGLEAVAGENCQKVTQGYAVEVAKKHLRKAGYQPIVTTLPTGVVQVTGRR